MTKEIEAKTLYFRSSEDVGKMKVAYVWTIVKTALIAVGMLGVMITFDSSPEFNELVASMVLQLAVNGFFIYGLSKIRRGEWRNKTAFGVCELLFSSIVAGILMLCCKKDV